MRSKYGQVCEKHPELAGRRYIPNNNCLKCHSESMKIHNDRRRGYLLELIAAAQESRHCSPRLDAALQAMGK
jgi:hypothetical protein